ncbi:MAG: hypothetical protein JWM05_1775 [Acidimicrobiales bacterium]|nr:hypothetical protein [Acidimicrobiales bacterium]
MGDAGGSGATRSPDERAARGWRARLADAATRRFLVGLVALTVLGLGVRIGYLVATTVPSRPGFLVNYDPIFYHQQALAVAGGRGFVAPYLSGSHPSAGHPPLLVVLLAVATKLHLASFAAHRAVTTVLGALAVPVVGLLGARLAGRRVGLAAAALAAVHPNLWAADGLLMPEGLYAVLVAAALLVAHEAWRGGRARWAGLLGVLIGLAALARGEGLLLLAALVVPVALWTPAAEGARRRVGLAAVALAAAGVTLLPWTAYNLHRFERPVLISTASDTTLAGASCDLSFRGDGLGFWTDTCFANVPNTLEESVFAARIRHQALDYVRGHERRLPVVVAARVGRVWQVYRPVQGITSDELQNRPRWASWAGLVAYAALVPLAAIGVVRLRRRGRPVVLLLGMFAMVTATAALFYGNVRFRIPGEIALVVLAAVPVADVGRRLRRPRSSAPPPGSPARS